MVSHEIYVISVTYCFDVNYKNNILSYKSYHNCDRIIMCIITCITVIPTNCFFLWHIKIRDDYKICCQCSYSFCEVCTLCLVGLWADMFTEKCNTFIVTHLVSHTVLLCTITIMYCLWYWYVIFNFLSDKMDKLPYWHACFTWYVVVIKYIAVLVYHCSFI